MYAFKSFINHGPMNVVTQFMGPSCHIIYTKRYIDAGEEILSDYVLGDYNEEERRSIL